MYTLYYSPGAASFAVHWLLLELDVPHRLEKIDLDGGQQRSEEYLRLNPNGRVPTLVVDGRAMYECAALMLLLADRHPDAALAPNVESPERESYCQWIVHLANTLQFAYELQKANRPFQLMLYPKSRHGVTDPLLVRHLRGLMLDYTLAHLQPDR